MKIKAAIENGFASRRIRHGVCFASLCIVVIATIDVTAREIVTGMSKHVYEGISAVQLLIDEENYPAALTSLNTLGDGRLNGYERSHVLSLTGYIYFQQNLLEQAIAQYREALTQTGLPDSQIRNLLNTVSQVCLVAGDYVEAEKFAQQMFDPALIIPPPSQSYIILAQSYIGQERFMDALEPLQTAIGQHREAGHIPRENWLAILSSVYYSLEKYEEMRDVLYELVSEYPREQYLINLAAIHGQLGETDRQLAVVESLLDDHRLSQHHHLLNLVNLLLAHGRPYKAATVLSEKLDSGEIKHEERVLELLSQALYQAGEERQAITPLEIAARENEDGHLYLRAARLYLDTYDYTGAEQAARLAIAMGTPRDPGGGDLILGMALTRQERFKEARRAFQQAEKHERNAKWARQWLKFVSNEQRRVVALGT